MAAGLVALALSLGACGGGSEAGGEEAPRAYPVEVTTAKLPTAQRLGETVLLRLGARNTGQRTVPSLTMGFEVEGEGGAVSATPFAIRSPEPELAQPDRPVWVLSEHYPRLAGQAGPAGGETASETVYDFGPLPAGETVTAVWELSAVRTGRYTLHYEIDASLDGSARAETAAGVQPGGSFAVRITEVPPETVVTDDGRVVEIPRGSGTQANR